MWKGEGEKGKERELKGRREEKRREEKRRGEKRRRRSSPVECGSGETKQMASIPGKVSTPVPCMSHRHNEHGYLLSFTRRRRRRRRRRSSSREGDGDHKPKEGAGMEGTSGASLNRWSARVCVCE